MKIYEIHGHVWDILALKKKMGYILNSEKVNASHICPPKRNKLLEQRKGKTGFSGKHVL